MIAPGEALIDLLRATNVTLGTGVTLQIQRIGAGGPGAANGHDQLAASGTVALGSAALELLVSDQPAVGVPFVIVTNATGLFLGLPEGATIVIPGGLACRISYVGGDGNDVSITRVNTAPVIGSIGSLPRLLGLE